MHMKNFKKCLIPFIIGGLSCGLLVSVTQNYNLTHHNQPQVTRHFGKNARADSDSSFKANDMEQAVERNDLFQLHKVGNQKAQLENSEAQKNGQQPIYKKSSDGNYWSYFEDHYALMSDDYNIKDNAGYSGDATAIDRVPSDSGVIANEKVLKKHGVKSGVNFEFHSSSDNDNNNTQSQATSPNNDD